MFQARESIVLTCRHVKNKIKNAHNLIKQGVSPRGNWRQTFLTHLTFEKHL